MLPSIVSIGRRRTDVIPVYCLVGVGTCIILSRFDRGNSYMYQCGGMFLAARGRAN